MMRKGLVLTITLLALLVMPTIVEARSPPASITGQLEDAWDGFRGFMNRIVENVMNVFRFMRGRVGSLFGVEASCLDDRFNDYCTCPVGSARRNAQWFGLEFYACELDNKVVDPDAPDFESQAFGYMAYLFSAECGIGYCDFTCEDADELQEIVQTYDEAGKRWLLIRCLKQENSVTAHTKYRMMASVEEGILSPYLHAFCTSEGYAHGSGDEEGICGITT